MEAYRKKIKRQLIASCCLVGVIVVILLIDQFGSFENNPNISGFVYGFQFGLIVAVEMLLLIKIARLRKALKDESTLNELYIKETDERRVLIAKEIGSFSINIILSILALATIIAGYFNFVVFITLLCVLIFASLTKGFAKFYFNRKY